MGEPLVDVTGARRRRARARLQRRLTVAAVLLAIVGVLGGSAWLFGSSPVFAAEEVVTDGLVTLTHDEVVAAAGVPLGEPLARLDTGVVEARVRELPAVAAVRVSPRFPHAVVVGVTERTPVLVVPAGPSFTWVDAEGVAFHEAPEAPPGTVEARGSRTDSDLLAAYAAVVASLPPALREQTERVSGRTVDSITLDLTDGRSVVWGSPEEAALKADVLLPLLAVKAREYDVSAPTHPTTR